MERYVDGYVIPLKKDKIGEYKALAEKACEVWKEHGALDYWECVGDDLEIEQTVSFKAISGASNDETVIFAWIVYESREHRDSVNKAVLKDPRIEEMMEAGSEPFDPGRMAYGGFRSLVRAE